MNSQQGENSSQTSPSPRKNSLNLYKSSDNKIHIEKAQNNLKNFSLTNYLKNSAKNYLSEEKLKFFHDFINDDKNSSQKKIDLKNSYYQKNGIKQSALIDLYKGFYEILLETNFFYYTCSFLKENKKSSKIIIILTESIIKLTFL